MGYIIINQKFFGSNIFHWLIFRVVLFSFIMTTLQNKLTLFIDERKKFAGLTFVAEGDQENFFAAKISQFTVHQNI